MASVTPIAFAQKLQRLHELQERIYNAPGTPSDQIDAMWKESETLRAWLDDRYPELAAKQPAQAIHNLMAQARHKAKATAGTLSKS